MVLIDREKLKENAFEVYTHDYGSIEVVGVDAVDESLVIDPVRHGKWMMDSDPDDGDCRCSNCYLCIDALHKRNHPLIKTLGYKLNTFYKYCPHCGAKMDLE